VVLRIDISQIVRPPAATSVLLVEAAERKDAKIGTAIRAEALRS
jgi:hypothetical protein